MHEFNYEIVDLDEDEELCAFLERLRCNAPSGTDAVLYYDPQKDEFIWFDPAFNVAYIYKFIGKVNFEDAIRTIIESKRCANCGRFHYASVYVVNTRELIILNDC